MTLNALGPQNRRHVTLEIMQGKLDRSAMQQTTRHVLRMLGIPDLVAKALIQTPLPAVAAPKKSAPENSGFQTFQVAGR